jgi:hypothetical protein
LRRIIGNSGARGRSRHGMCGAILWPTSQSRKPPVGIVVVCSHYCRRGQAENHIKSWKMRLSPHERSRTRRTLRSYHPIWMRPQQPHAVFLRAGQDFEPLDRRCAQWPVCAGLRPGAKRSLPPAATGLVGERARPLRGRQKFLAVPCFLPETGRVSRKNREAIEHERAITVRD